jgi:hypothetical protein
MLTITDNIIDDLAHKIADTLKSHGIDMSTDSKYDDSRYDLSDCISSFLQETFPVQVVEQGPSLDSGEVVILFNISETRGKQTLKILNDRYSYEEIVSGLNDQTLQTTIDHHANQGSFVRVAKTGENVALITSQTFSLECMNVE